MSGHVFHPGHDALHGVTVVIAGASGKTYVGRWHERNDRGVIVRDAAIHDPTGNPLPRDAWLERQRKFGVAVVDKHLAIPNTEVVDVRMLNDEP